MEAQSRSSNGEAGPQEATCPTHSPGQSASSLSSSQVTQPSHCQGRGMHWMAPLRQANCPGLHRSSVEPKGKRPLRKRQQQWRPGTARPAAARAQQHGLTRAACPWPDSSGACAWARTRSQEPCPPQHESPEQCTPKTSLFMCHLKHTCHVSAEPGSALDYRGHKRAYLPPQEGFWVNRKDTHTFLTKSK